MKFLNYPVAVVDEFKYNMPLGNREGVLKIMILESEDLPIFLTIVSTSDRGL